MIPENENKSSDTFENNIRNTFPEPDELEKRNVQPTNQNNTPITENQNVSIRERGTMRVRRKKRIIIFSILAVILIVGGYFLYDLVLKDLFNKKPVEEEIEIDISNINVSNGYSGKSNFIAIPQIDADTKEVYLLNLKMMSDSYKTLEYLRKGFFDKASKEKNKDDYDDFYDCYKNLKYDYKVYRRKGILIINVIADSLTRDWNSCILEDAPTYESPEYFYFYDVQNDKALDFYDAVEQLEIDIDSETSECESYNELRNYKGKIHVKSDALGDLEIICSEY